MSNILPKTVQQPVRLADFIQRIKQRIEQIDALWLKAEVIKLVNHDRYVQIELADYSDSHDRKLLARASAYINWRNKKRLLDKFLTGTGLMLSEGQSILVMVKPLFSPQYGFSFEIIDIDPSYTVGQLYQKIEYIRFRLKQLNEFNLQQQLSVGLDIKRIAVIAPEQAAGLADFIKTIGLIKNFIQFDYYHPKFSGTDMVDSFTQTFVQIFKQHQETPYDLICIIRGGGDSAGLFNLNQFKIVRLVCRIPIPVVVGIGHERDRTLLDEVAFHSFSTPSKVASWLVEQAKTIVWRFDDFCRDISRYSSDYLFSTQAKLTSLNDLVQSTINQTIQSVEKQALNTKHTISKLAMRLMNLTEKKVKQFSHNISTDALNSCYNSARYFQQSISQVFTSSSAFILNKASSIEKLLQESLNQSQLLVDENIFKQQRAVHTITHAVEYLSSVTADKSNTLYHDIVFQGKHLISAKQDLFIDRYNTIAAFNIEQIKAQGFAIVWQHEQIIVKAEQLQKGPLSIEFADGIINVNKETE
jgi:exodeoxyribonuclease VII large subunit